VKTAFFTPDSGLTVLDFDQKALARLRSLFAALPESKLS
jgi:hypothetical protein